MLLGQLACHAANKLSMPHHTQKQIPDGQQAPSTKIKASKNWEKRFANRYMGKGSILRIYVELLLTNKITKREDEQRL